MVLPTPTCVGHEEISSLNLCYMLWKVCGEICTLEHLPAWIRACFIKLNMYFVLFLIPQSSELNKAIFIVTRPPFPTLFLM